MASEDRRKRRALADCTNTSTPTRRLRRSYDAYGNEEPSQASPAFASKRGQGSQELSQKGKQRKKKSEAERAELNDDENRSQLQAEVPARSPAFGNNNSDDFSTVSVTCADDHDAEDPTIDQQNLHTPQAVLRGVRCFRFPEENGDGDLQGSSAHSARRETRGRGAENLSLSCPPLGRAALGSAAVERSQKYIYRGVQIWKRCSTDASADLPESVRCSANASTGLTESDRHLKHASTDLAESGKQKKKVRRRRNSMPECGGKHSIPEDFIREQQAHFAEVDAFQLQEEDDLSEAD